MNQTNQMNLVNNFLMRLLPNGYMGDVVDQVHLVGLVHLVYLVIW